MAMQGLEPLFQFLRISKVWHELPRGGVLVDLGCDYEQTLMKMVRSKMSRVIGLDMVVKNSSQKALKADPSWQLVQADLTKRLPLPTKTADVVTMLAVLEHLPGPEKVVKEVYRILKPGGAVLITVPAPKAEQILPALAKMHFVRQEMIDQHENYFTDAHLRKILKAAGFKNIFITRWEFGFNTFVRAQK